VILTFRTESKFCSSLSSSTPTLPTTTHIIMCYIRLNQNH